MPIKLLKNGKQQQTALLLLFFSLLFFFFFSFCNCRFFQRPADKLTALPQPFSTQLVGNLQEVWWKWEQKCARCFWLLRGYQWMMLPCSNFWHLSQLGPSAPCSALANSTLISLALWAGWPWRIRLSKVKLFLPCTITAPGFLSYWNLEISFLSKIWGLFQHHTP